MNLEILDKNQPSFVFSKQCLFLQNAVIVQPSTMPQQVMGIQTEPANTSIVLTILLMVLCLLVVNLPAMICLIPALIFSVLVSYI